MGGLACRLGPVALACGQGVHWTPALPFFRQKRGSPNGVQGQSPRWEVWRAKPSNTSKDVQFQGIIFGGHMDGGNTAQTAADNRRRNFILDFFANQVTQISGTTLAAIGFLG